MNRSSSAARLGALVEAAGRRRYGLEEEHGELEGGVRADAEDDAGRPWEIKGALLTRDPPRFRLWKDQHQQLAEAGGGYVFIGYRIRGEGIEVLESRSIRARDLRVRWYGAGGHRDGAEQLKIRAGAVLS